MASTDPQNERQRDSEHAQDHEIDLPEKPLSMVFSEAAVFQPPNGGLRAWSCVAGALLLQFCSFGFVNAYARFYTTSRQPLTLPQMRCFPVLLSRDAPFDPVVFKPRLDNHASDLSPLHTRPISWQARRCLRLQARHCPLFHYGCLCCLYDQPLYQVLADHVSTRDLLRAGGIWTLSPRNGIGYTVVFDETRACRRHRRLWFKLGWCHLSLRPTHFD